MKTTTGALAIGFWLWCAVIAIGGGFIGSALNCDESDAECRDGFPSWFEPWTWGDHDVYPAALIIGAAGLVAASAFVVFVFRRERLSAGITLPCTLVLLSYPFFAGLTSEGRLRFGLGPFWALGRSRS